MRGSPSAAVFLTNIDDMQREVNLLVPDGSVIQIIENTAGAKMANIEFGGLIRLTDNLVATSNAGFINADFGEVIFDLNGDGMVDDADESLTIPRVPELAYSMDCHMTWKWLAMPY